MRILPEDLTYEDLLQSDLAHTDPLFEKIGECESGHNPMAQNRRSSAGGEYQFIDGTWEAKAKQLWGDEWESHYKKNQKDNRDLAWYVYTHYGTSDWEADPASYNCWKVLEDYDWYRNIL